MKIKCYSVRLAKLVEISDKAYRAVSFDGSEAIIPISQVMGQDLDVKKCEAYWISGWILDRKRIQYSLKKYAWFDEKGHKLPDIEFHKAKKVEPIDNNLIKDLLK